MFKKIIVSVLLLSTINLMAQDTSSSAMPISGDWYGWSDMMLMNNDGVVNGTYNDTWGDEPGYFRFYKSGGEWTGQWGEESIGRRGIFYNVVVAEDGKNIRGKYSVVEVGSSGGPKEDVDFSFNYVEDGDGPGCEFPDLSEIWECEGKGYFEISQTNLEAEGDCVSYLEGKFVRYNCSEDLWAMSLNDVNYVRGKIVNGQYNIEIFPKKKKENIYSSRQRTTLSGTIEMGDTTFNPLLQFGLTHVVKDESVVIDPHNGQEVIVMQWEYAPVTVNNNCGFKKTSSSQVQNQETTGCEKCKQQTLPEGFSYFNNRFTNTDEKLMVEAKDAANPRYAVGSGAAKQSGSGLWYTSDLMNTQVNAVPRYNLRITKVEREGKFIDVFYQVCDLLSLVIVPVFQSHTW